MAVEAVKFGYAGQSYIALVMCCRRDTVVRVKRKIATKADLAATVHVFKKLSQTQRKATDAFGEYLPIEFDSILPR